MKITLSILGAALAFAAGPAAAAPQILGIVASTTPLTCEDGTCVADLSAFCLQQTRPMPGRGTAYEPAEDAPIALVATLPSGETVRLPVPTRLGFTSNRGFTAVRVSLPEAALATLGVTSVAVEIGERASLLPKVRVGDSSPQSPEEVELATGAMRQVADRFFADNDAAADAARLTNLLVNALPERGRSAADRVEEGDRLWRETISPAVARRVSPAGLDLARKVHGDCRDQVAVGIAYSLRRCLEASHDRLIVDTNLRFWESIGGS